jgi:integrase
MHHDPGKTFSNTNLTASSSRYFAACPPSPLAKPHTRSDVTLRSRRSFSSWFRRKIVVVTRPLVTVREDLPFIRAKSKGDAGPIFVDADGGLLRAGTVRVVFNKAFKACKLDYNASHICRHTLATLGLIATGGNIIAIQATLGHRDQKVTQRYAKVVAMLSRDVMEKTANLLRKPIESAHPDSHTPSDQ